MTDLITVNQTELADFLSCTTKTVRDYANKGVLNDECMVGNKYDLKKSTRAVTDHLRTIASQHLAESNDGEVLNPSLESAKLNRAKTKQAEVATEKLEIERDLKAAQLALISADLMSMSEATNVVGRYITSARSKLLGLTASLPVQIHGLNARDIETIKDSIYDILESMADDFRGFKDDLTDEVLDKQLSQGK